LRVLILKTQKNLQWGDLDVPVMGLQTDWYGQSVTNTLMFSLVSDPRYLWFIAASNQPAKNHPAARPGNFTAELWKYDVAELFIADPESGRYIEFNLAANGAWWSCEFTAPRHRAEEIDIAFPDVATFAEISLDGGWMSAMAIPLDVLQARVNFGNQSRANVSFITASPEQRFISATKLPKEEPDFHMPADFSPLRFHSLDE
jgi:hypothetical protein